VESRLESEVFLLNSGLWLVALNFVTLFSPLTVVLKGGILCGSFPMTEGTDTKLHITSLDQVIARDASTLQYCW
jgi:hypothetical protein